MENIFEKGNKITTNNLNCFEVIDTNDYQVVCKDLLNGDFSVFDKTEHKFERANIKLILIRSLQEIINEIGLSPKDRHHILLELDIRLSKWL